MLLDPLNHFEIRKYYQNNPKINGVYTRNNLPEIKYGTYLITPLIVLYVKGENVTYFDSFGV